MVNKIVIPLISSLLAWQLYTVYEMSIEVALMKRDVRIQKRMVKHMLKDFDRWKASDDRVFNKQYEQ